LLSSLISGKVIWLSSTQANSWPEWPKPGHLPGHLPGLSLVTCLAGILLSFYILGFWEQFWWRWNAHMISALSKGSRATMRMYGKYSTSLWKKVGTPSHWNVVLPSAKSWYSICSSSQIKIRNFPAHILYLKSGPNTLFLSQSAASGACISPWVACNIKFPGSASFLPRAFSHQETPWESKQGVNSKCCSFLKFFFFWQQWHSPMCSSKKDTESPLQFDNSLNVIQDF
jgi:hypothetical protein